MISYKKQKYNDIRTPIPDDVFVKLLQDTLKVNGVELSEDVSRRVLASLLTSMAYYLYNCPEYYIDFKKIISVKRAQASTVPVSIRNAIGGIFYFCQ